MFSKEQFLDSLQHETDICKHLFGKIPPGGLEYRPTPGQRNTLELLQYMTLMLKAPVRCILKGDWSDVHADVEQSKQLTAEQFCSAMDQQMDIIRTLLKDIGDEELLQKDTVTPRGPAKMGQALVNLCLKFATAYRMQLFLYLKSLGLSELGTYNCWGGIDKPTQ